MVAFTSLHLAVAFIATLVHVPSVCAFALPSWVRDAGSQLQFGGNHWVDTWTAMPQLTEAANLPPPPFVSSYF